MLNIISCRGVKTLAKGSVITCYLKQDRWYKPQRASYIKWPRQNQYNSFIRICIFRRFAVCAFRTNAFLSMVNHHIISWWFQNKWMPHCVLVRCGLKIPPHLFFCHLYHLLCDFFFLSITCSGSWNARFSDLTLNCCHGLLLFTHWNYQVLLAAVLFSFIFMPYILYDHLMNALNSNTCEYDSHASFMNFSCNFCSPFHAPGMAWTFFLPIVNITFIVLIFILLPSW